MVSIEGLFEKWVERDKYLVSFYVDDKSLIRNDAIKQFNADRTALIKQEALKMLPFKIHNPISEFERGFGAGIDITQQNISNYTIGRSGE